MLRRRQLAALVALAAAATRSGNQLARISSFGEDARGEMYLVTRERGRLFHIAAQ